MKILYIFPHPDDESFGPAPAMWEQQALGHEVYLLTLTKGGETRMRHKYGWSVAKMGEIRAQELANAAAVLGVKSLHVLDLPDSGLKELRPQEIELLVSHYIQKIEPNIVVTYPVHGISGFHDHLITHAVVKRCFVALQQAGNGYLKRLAFFTLPEFVVKSNTGLHQLQFSTSAEIACVYKVSEKAMQKMYEALECYVTYQEIIEASIKKMQMPRAVYFEIFGEKHQKVLCALTENMLASVS